MKLYLKVTKDKYELPVIVADTPGELAKKAGIKYNTLLSALSKGSRSYKRVDIDDEELENNDSSNINRDNGMGSSKKR